jgi:hypothetical protein
MHAPHPDRSWIADFYQQLDPERVLAALQRVSSQSSGAVTTTTLWSREPGEENLRGAESGIFAPEIFGGDPGRFGHVETAGVLHPAAFRTLQEEFGLTYPKIEAIARRELVLRGTRAVLADDLEDGDLTGPLAFAEALRRKVPDHPHLPLCAVTKIPVPPIAARAPRPGTRPELVDPWIGPENEAWQVLVFRAKRHLRLQELEAPEVILAAEALVLQQAFDAVFKITSSSYSWLFPPLTRAIDTEVKALAFAGDRRLLVQSGDRVRLVDHDGRELRSFEPANCTLRGVVHERYAVFQEIVEGGQHPSFGADDTLWPSWFAHVDAEGCAQVVDPILAVSVLDLETGKYLVERPSWLPSAFPENHEPEELFFDDRPLFVGGDRPSAMSYSHDLRFVCVGDDLEMHILELESGRPAAIVAHVSRASHQLDLATGTFRELDPDLDVESTPNGSAIVFADGAWRLLNPDGILTDHLGRDPIQLVPSPFASAFSAAGGHLAVTYLRPDDSAEIAVLDLKARAVVARFSPS